MSGAAARALFKAGQATAVPAMKYILVTGGVISGVGKGIIASSLGLLLKLHGYRVSAIKIDPYLNIDAGMFSPYEHGEVFVLDDGGEVDLDLGNYERFMGVRLTRDNNITTGKIYKTVIERERNGDYLGKTVQVVPHITDMIQTWTERVAHTPVDGSQSQPHVCIIELGGTVGDIEGMPFVEAFRQFHTLKVDRQNFMNVHVSLIPQTSSGEQKTKPTQMSVQDLRGRGLFPDLIMCRSTNPIAAEVKAKISTFCHVRPSQVVGVHDVDNIYYVPLLLNDQGVMDVVVERLELNNIEDRQMQAVDPMSKWRRLARGCSIVNDQVTIALVGKYVKLSDAYTSVLKALQHAAIFCERKLVVRFVESEDLEEKKKQENPSAYYDAWKSLATSDGVLVPGGFGQRGIEGKIVACNHARIQKKPFLGVCLGMQCAVIEYARNVLGIEDADSTEFAQERGLDLDGSRRVIIDMPEHSPMMNNQGMGATQRLGSRSTVFLTKDSKLRGLYGGVRMIEERHRHRYEVNPALIPSLQEHGLQFVGMGLEDRLHYNQSIAPETETPSRLSECESVASSDLPPSQSYADLMSLAKKGEQEVLAKALHTKLESLRLDSSAAGGGVGGSDSKAVGGSGDHHPSFNLHHYHHDHSEPIIRMEICEIKDHPYFVGVQFHPEYLSLPLKPSPPFLGLLLAASKQDFGREMNQNLIRSPEK